MERPLKEIKLLKSGYTAKIITFFTRGEASFIDSKQFEGGNLDYVEGQVKITNLPVDFQTKQEDAILITGVKEILDEKGASIIVTKDVLDNLPNQDIKVLLSELRNVDSDEQTSKKK